MGRKRGGTLFEAKSQKKMRQKTSKQRKTKKAVWLFLQDHAHKQRSGRLKIVFTIDNEGNFWERVRAREFGYRRKD